MFLIATLLFAEVNLTQFSDPGYLRQLIHSIDQNASKNEALLLQKTLALKILAPMPKPKTISLPSPTDQTSLTKTIQQGLDLFKKIEKTKRQIATIDEKITTLQKELQTSDPALQQTLALQLVYHQKERKSLQSQLSIYQKTLEKLKSIISSSIDHIAFDPETIQKRLAKTNQEIASLQERIQTLQLRLERYNLINDQKSVRYLQTLIDKANAKLDQLRQNLLALKTIQLLYAIQTKSSQTIALKNELLTHIQDSDLRMSFDRFFSSLIKERLGFLKTIKLTTKEKVENSFETLWNYLNKPLFTIGDQKISLLKLLLALFTFLVAIFIGALYKRSIHRIDSRSISSSTKTLLANLGYYFILLVAFFISLNILHINLTSIALIAGALSVGIGFGLQNIVSNFVSGLILMFERSIKIGDYIEIDGELRGRVTDIRMRSTTINTNDNIDIVVPNQKLIQDNVINWTMNDKIRRFEIPFGVAYGTNPSKVIDVVLDAVKKSGFKDIYHSKDRYTRVIMTGMGDSSLDFKLFVWIKGEEVLYPKRTTSRFLILIYEALQANGIEIPFPQRDLHLRSIDPNIRLNINIEGEQWTSSKPSS